MNGMRAWSVCTKVPLGTGGVKLLVGTGDWGFKLLAYAMPELRRAAHHHLAYARRCDQDMPTIFTIKVDPDGFVRSGRFATVTMSYDPMLCHDTQRMITHCDKCIKVYNLQWTMYGIQQRHKLPLY